MLTEKLEMAYVLSRKPRVTKPKMKLLRHIMAANNVQLPLHGASLSNYCSFLK